MGFGIRRWDAFGSTPVIESCKPNYRLGSELTKVRLSIASPVCPRKATSERMYMWSHQSAGAPRGAQDVPHWWEGVRRLLTEINLPSHYHFRSKQDRP